MSSFKAQLTWRVVHAPPGMERILVLLAGTGSVAVCGAPAVGMLWVDDHGLFGPRSGDHRGVDRSSGGARDEIRTLNGAPVAGQREVVFGLLDVIGRDAAKIIDVTDSTERRHLTQLSDVRTWASSAAAAARSWQGDTEAS